ncbi:MAG: glycosyltransferase [Actinobacteria bacterium]|nr:glycosyltransferase [Actinomycetota bacterium]
MMGVGKEKPTVSVIIPAYNRAGSIGSAIESVLSQTYGNFEILVIDDASLDSTQEVVNGYEDDRIRLIPSHERGGAAKARNIGIGQARGEFVSFLDSDDRWRENKLQCDIGILRAEPQCIACTSGIVYVDGSDGRIIGSAPSGTIKVTRESVLRMDCSTAVDITVRRSVLKEIGGFDESLAARQDWDLWIRMTAVGYGIQERMNTYINYVKRGDQISTGREKKIRGTSMLLEKHRELFEADRIAHRKILNVIALMYILDDDPRAVEYLERSCALTSEKVKRAKIWMSMMLIKALGAYGTGLLGWYFRKTHAEDYLLW